MKVESTPEAQTVRQLDKSVLVKAKRPAKPIASGVNELANIFSQEVAINSTTLSNRVMKQRVAPVEHMSQLYRQLGHPAQESLESLSRRVRLLLLQNSSVEALLELTGRDPARAHVVLRHVAAQAEAEMRKKELALASEARVKLEMRYEREIRAGINIAKALQVASDDPQEREAVRALYYASVVVRQSLATMMQSLLGIFGGERFAAGLKLMSRALADDIAAHVSSVPTGQLRTLLQGLKSCSHLVGVLLGCQDLTRRLKVEQDAVVLLQRFLGYTTAGVTSNEVLRLAGEFGGESASRQLVSLNALYPLVQRLPVVLWRDSQGRKDALNNFLVVMDEFTRCESARKPFNIELRAQV
ncbi:SepL/TyeA/HrpJ family type III secretion system gatekeeper [Pseudomonas sp. S35]|uniref:type III secretion system gatekeeper subunit SctW n=1 Tax=Pseudomonas sp. S35 TaxID=1573719 RepID=UPI00132F454D|nr:type III secretion system gatekeeper subunit SctW [Pseudomonas sp. S35]QHF42927.1 SepL/TyeA/HrpJ family type III secretion system gatekeeper [Pseudomonas sp. S35]